MKTVSEILQEMELSRIERKIIPSSVLYVLLVSECVKHGHDVWQINSKLRELKNLNKIVTDRTINGYSISWKNEE